MATLYGNEEKTISLAISLNLSEFAKYPFLYVKCEIVLQFGDKLQPITLVSNSPEVEDIEDHLIKPMQAILDKKIDEFEFEPVDPDFSIKIKRHKYDNKDHYCEVITNLYEGGLIPAVYTGNCLSLTLSYITHKELQDFKEQLESELQTEKDNPKAVEIARSLNDKS